MEEEFLKVVGDINRTTQFEEVTDWRSIAGIAKLHRHNYFSHMQRLTILLKRGGDSVAKDKDRDIVRFAQRLCDYSQNVVLGAHHLADLKFEADFSSPHTIFCEFSKCHAHGMHFQNVIVAASDLFFCRQDLDMTNAASFAELERTGAALASNVQRIITDHPHIETGAAFRSARALVGQELGYCSTEISRAIDRALAEAYRPLIKNRPVPSGKNLN